MAKCIQLDRYCADICRMAAAWMARVDGHTRQLVDRLCTLCAETCEMCAAECRKHDMDHCQRCADACTECARLCRAMATQAA